MTSVPHAPTPADGERRGVSVTTFPTLFREALTAWNADYAPSMGAALSYYTLFSLAPLLLIAIALAGVFFGEDAARGQVVSALGTLMGSDGARSVEDMIKSAQGTGDGIVASAVGIMTLLLGATSVFGELQSSLDRIWRAPQQERERG